jgi:AbrB family looped-hinge helix DNA binding protein
MQEFETTLTEKGQVTIPQEIRRYLGLRPGDKVRFEVDGEAVKIKHASSKLLQGFGAVKPIQKPENFQKLRENFEEGIARDAVYEV